MVISDFSFSRIPKIIFGAGKFQVTADVAGGFGTAAVVVTGGRSLKQSGQLDHLLESLKQHAVDCYHYTISGEPSPEQIDAIVADAAGRQIDVVIAVGGGSVIDGGKAISAMLGKDDSVMEYLEGVGTLTHDGSKVPFIAVPTTAGTGSEATKNAVLSHIGPDGFKKSLRHDHFVPDVAIVDPALSVTCPAEITAACGMDAFTQLLESYVSVQASPMTDALALGAIGLVKGNLPAACSSGANDVQVRAAMAYASMVSGMTLANAGLGIVHGLASAVGGLFDIPHGVVCGTLVGAATKTNIELLKRSQDPLLDKYADVGRLFAGGGDVDMEASCQALMQTLDFWVERLGLPKLTAFGVRECDLDKIIDRTGNKNNPVKLDRSDIKEILLKRM
ncbi:MAG: iron-containing alcohol dehydrogenase [Planctomycetota bacterium]|jgi:alcohol dehydrogenase class IV